MNDDPIDDWTKYLNKLNQRYTEKGFLPRDPENLDPYGPQNHPLKENKDASS